MAQWTIDGSDACDGSVVQATIEADDDQQAATLAREHGILVRAIELAPVPTLQAVVKAVRWRPWWLGK